METIKILKKIHVFVATDGTVWLSEKDLRSFRVQPIRQLWEHEYEWQTINMRLYISAKGFINRYCLNNRCRIGERLLKAIVQTEPPLNVNGQPLTYVHVMELIDAYQMFGMVPTIRKHVLQDFHWKVIDFLL
jgi:hypothetical protein